MICRICRSSVRCVNPPLPLRPSPAWSRSSFYPQQGIGGHRQRKSGWVCWTNSNILLHGPRKDRGVGHFNVGVFSRVEADVSPGCCRRRGGRASGGDGGGRGDINIERSGHAAIAGGGGGGRMLRARFSKRCQL